MIHFPWNVGLWPRWSNLLGIVPTGVTSLIMIRFLLSPNSPSHSSTECVDDDIEVVGTEEALVDEETSSNLHKSFDNEYVKIIWRSADLHLMPTIIQRGS